jgi:hypothetical protein
MSALPLDGSGFLRDIGYRMDGQRMGTLGGTGFGFNPLGAAGPGGSMYGGGFGGGFGRGFGGSMPPPTIINGVPTQLGPLGQRGTRMPDMPRQPMFGGGFGGGFGMPQQNFPGMGGGMQMPGMGGPAFPQQQFNQPQQPMFGGGFGGGIGGGFGGGFQPGRPRPPMFGGGQPPMPGMFGGGPPQMPGMFGGRAPQMPSLMQLQQRMGGMFGSQDRSQMARPNPKGLASGRFSDLADVLKFLKR